MNLYDVLAGQGTTHFERLFSQQFGGGGKTQTLTGVPPLEFPSKTGKPLISWSMLGNAQQTGTPTPEDPIDPEFVGTLSGANWIIPITCAGQTTPVYLGQVSTVRRIKKMVLDGTEVGWTQQSASGGNIRFRLTVSNAIQADAAHVTSICTHLVLGAEGSTWNTNLVYTISSGYLYLRIDGNQSLADFKAYLAAQYVAGTPVTVWYVLATEKTGIINEPLCKIGDYADELHSEDTTVTIPTIKGQNTLTVEGDLPPSSMTITYKS